MIIRLLSLLLLLPLVTACVGAATVSDMEKRSNYGRQLVIPENYQAVYRRVDDELSRCLTHNWGMRRFQEKKWKSNLYPEIRKGEVILEGNGGIRFLMLIEPIDEQNTRVDFVGWSGGGISPGATWHTPYVRHWAKFIEEGKPFCPD